jgi:SNF2 family DNA or RNA helicase
MSDPNPTIVTLEKGRVYVRSHFTYKERCTQIPGGRWDKAATAWNYPISPATAQAILDAFRGTPVRADAEFRKLVQKAREQRELAAVKTATDLPDIPYTRTKPWLHQLRAYHFAYPMQACMLALDMGCGKSKSTVDLIVNRGHKRTLLCAPLSVIQEWPHQFKTHAGKPVIVCPLDNKAGSVKDKVTAAKMALFQAEQEGKQVVIVTNYETVWREPFGPVYEKVEDPETGKMVQGDRIIDKGFAMQAGFDLVALDEIHRIQAANGKASKFLGRLGDKVPYKLGLTGTPFSSGPLSIYAQYRFLDKGIFGSSNKEFKSRYAVQGGFGGNQVVGFQNEEELQRKFYSIAFRVESRDVLDLPEEQHIVRTVTLSAAAMKAYKELEKQFIAKFQEGEVTVTNALTKLLRLQQLTSGYARLDETFEEEGKTIRVDHEKQKVLEDIFEDLDKREPIIVFARFTHDLEAVAEVCKKQGRRCGFLDGSRKDLEAWRNGEYDVLAVQIKAGGTGVNATRAKYCVYYSMGYSLADYRQSLARVMRPGQKHNVTYYHLVAEKTVDQKVYKALDTKQEVVQSILSDLR